MFHGTTDSRYPGKKVLIETHYLEKLDCSYVCKECFNIIILKSGIGLAEQDHISLILLIFWNECILMIS